MSDPVRPADDLEQLQRALVALKKARARIETLERAHAEPIAIVGLGCRLPGGANSPQAFWELLRAGRSGIIEIPPERWDVNAHFDARPDVPGKMPSRYGGFIRNIDQFDAHFFGIAPREANAMDPQQRLILEVAWEALEDAGLVPARLAGSATGVFIGLGINDYGRLQVVGQELDPARIDNYYVQGNALCITANRLSYTLDFRGPSMVIDTACSSSLVAIHVACQSLRHGDCSTALVGGVNLMLAPANSISLTKFLAPDGQCKTFDARADGYVRGEGALMLVLKPLARALAENLPIYAVIRGSAINQDGFSSGLTVPNGVAQEAMLQAALRAAGVAPEQIDYVEAHGTGTSLGDPIEANALGAAIGAHHPAGNPLYVGSVKTNLGHLEAGAGLAGLAKVALALKHGIIPPSLNFATPNPHIDFEQLRLRVPQTASAWPNPTRPALAGVSSFGFGGANAHAILEAPPALTVSALPTDRPAHLLTLSGKTAPALLAQAQQYAAHLAAHPNLNVAEVCFSAAIGRSHFAHRVAIVAHSIDELRADLTAFTDGQPSARTVSGVAHRAAQPKVAFLFTGQGAQYAGMGRQLYDTQPAFRAALQQCAEILQPHLPRPLLDVVFAPSASDLIHQTAYTQPALFALEYALAQLWRAWGVEPAGVLGHSVGEYVAACVAGALSLEDGLKLIAARGRLMQALPSGGAMAAVFASAERVAPLLAPHAAEVSLAALNGPESVVISGAEHAVQSILQQLQAEGIKARRLQVSHAFHSPLMEPMLAEFESVARACQFSAPRVSLASNLTGQLLAAGEAPTARYWRDHVRAAVNFESGLRALHHLGCEVFVEIGPNPTLVGLGQRCLPDGAGTWLPSLREGHSDWDVLLKSLGAAYAHGVDVDWEAFERDYAPGRARVALPTYPFQRERFWFQTSGTEALEAWRAQSRAALHPLLESRLRSPAVREVIFEAHPSLTALPYLVDHAVYGAPVFPATGYVEMALAAAQHAFGAGAYALAALEIQEALLLTADETPAVQIVLSPLANNESTFTIHSAASPEAEWRLHASGRLVLNSAASPEGVLASALTACPAEQSVSDFYAAVRATGMEYGPQFQNVRALWRGDQQALGRAALTETLAAEAEHYHLHPALLDAALQVLAAALPSVEGETYLPVTIERIHLARRGSAEIWSHARLTSPAAETTTGDVILFDVEGQWIGQVTGIRLKRASRAALAHIAARGGARSPFADWLYQIDWLPQPQTESLALGPSLLFADEQGVGAELARQLADAAQWCGVVTRGSTYQRLDSTHWQIDSSQPADFQRVLNEITAPLQNVFYLWALDAKLDEAAPVDSLNAELSGALHLAQTLAQRPTPAPLALVTRGAQPVTADDVALAQAPLWGFARALRLEYPAWRCVTIDLDPAALPTANAQFTLAELNSVSTETEVAYRNETRYAARLTQRAAAAETSVKLEIAQRGTLEHLALTPAPRRAPGPGEVEIRVRATGLNFRDVLTALDMYPGATGVLGNECAGEIAAVGEGVSDLHVGEAVLALAFDCFGTYAVTRAEYVARKLAALSFEDAATLPIAFLTADYALRILGQLRAGERVLIHAAAGGVGLAAVQLAQLAGAEIFATAGSADKRAFLKALGVPHVLDSRALSFADDILRLTDGAGVDVVLNSLSDDFIAHSFRVLKTGGRFLEIGKRGIWTPEQVATLGRAHQYHIIYLGEVAAQQPALMQTLLATLLRHIEVGALRPLPWRAFALTRATEAFRFMAQAKHIGKIVITQPAPPQREMPAIRADAAYLITGGLGGMGLVLAQRLVEQGARALVLVGRSQPTESARAAIQKMEDAGVRVWVKQADVSRADQMESVLAEMRAGLPPLRGVIHAAGALDDATLPQQNWARFAVALAPKVAGAWHLHRLTQDLPLDFFIAFSAGAGWLGSAGQANYSAANVFVDALAHARRAHGWPALSVAWGAWSDVGMAARLSAHGQDRLAQRGLGQIAPAQGAQIFESLLSAQGVIGVLPIEWNQFLARFDSAPPFYAEMARAAPAAARPTAPDILKRLADAPAPKRLGLLQDHIRQQALRVLGLSPSHTIDPREPLRELGLDSLMAVELRNALGASLKQTLPATLLFDYPTCEALADYLRQTIPALAAPAEPAPVSETDSARAAAVSDVAALSDDEAEALLLEELNRMKK